MTEIQCRDKGSAKKQYVTGDYTDHRYWKRAKQYAVNAIADELEGWENERTVLLKGKEAARREKEDAARRKIEEMKAEIADIRSKLEAIKEGNYVLKPEEKEELERLKAEAGAAKNAAEKAKAELAVMPEKKEIDHLERSITIKQSQLAGLGLFKGKEKKDLKEQISILEQTLSSIKNIVGDKVMTVRQLEDEYRTAQSKVDGYFEHVTKYEEERLRNRMIFCQSFGLVSK